MTLNDLCWIGELGANTPIINQPYCSDAFVIQLFQLRLSDKSFKLKDKTER